MTPPDRFDLDEYVLLLQAAREGGYRFAGFDRSPEPGDVILRHDVDLSLEVRKPVATGPRGVEELPVVVERECAVRRFAAARWNVATSAGCRTSRVLVHATSTSSRPAACSARRSASIEVGAVAIT